MLLGSKYGGGNQGRATRGSNYQKQAHVEGQPGKRELEKNRARGKLIAVGTSGKSRFFRSRQITCCRKEVRKKGEGTKLYSFPNFELVELLLTKTEEGEE